MKEILMVPGLILAVVLCPLLAGACYVAIWRYYRQEENLNGN